MPSVAALRPAIPTPAKETWLRASIGMVPTNTPNASVCSTSAATPKCAAMVRFLACVCLSFGLTLFSG